MVAPDLPAPPASPRAPRSWQKNRSLQQKQLCATVSFLQQPSLCKENLERLRNSLVFEPTKSLQKKT